MTSPRALVKVAIVSLSAVALSGVMACSSSAKPTNQGLAAGTEPTGTDVNPYGVAYPTAGLGFKPRGDPSSQAAGDKIKNFKFLGYVDSNKSSGLTTISLADFFDPDM